MNEEKGRHSFDIDFLEKKPQVCPFLTMDSPICHCTIREDHS